MIKKSIRLLSVSFSSFSQKVVMKYLNVAEKNDAAKNIANFLSRGTSKRREGFSQYNKIYEFEADVFGQRSKMVMTSVSGHLLTMDFVSAYKNWNSCNPLSLFEAPIYKFCPGNYEKIKKTLENEIRTCNGLIIWTDCDREGENIGFEIVEVCSGVKPNITVHRAKFSEITNVSVARALNNLERPDKNTSDAVDVRQELDLRIGAAFTRFQTLRLQRVFPSKLADSLVSYGSCQFPTLGFVVERYRAVENFVSEPFWKLKVTHTMNDLSVEFNWARVRLFDELACKVLHDICLENTLARVVDIKTKPKSKWRPLPLDTVELEKLASRKLKISAKTTMKIAEKLYTQGFISYPRTETNEYPKEMNLGQLVTMHTPDSQWGSFAQRIMDEGGPTPRQGNKSDKAHPPIHPTKYTNNLSGDEKRLYEFIVRSFLACCHKDAQGQETTVTIQLSGETFHTSGLMIISRNYLEVYPYDKWSAKEIHVYEMNQTFEPTSIDMVGGSTSPPNLLTEADLIALMEKHGIGTDATHADHIETIKSRSYVALLESAHFVPGLLGMGLVEGYDSMGLEISKPNLRAQLEADLKLICEGRKQPADVLADQIEKYKRVYEIATGQVLSLDTALAQRFRERPVENVTSNISTVQMNPVMKCPKCNMDMILRQKKNADEHYLGCQGFPQCKNAMWFPAIVKNVSVTDQNCARCGPSCKKLRFEWRNNSIEHLFPMPYITCIKCDNSLLDILNLHPSSRNQTQPQQRTNSQNSLRNNEIRNSASVINTASVDSGISEGSNTWIATSRRNTQNINTNVVRNIPSVSGNTASVVRNSQSVARRNDDGDNNVICGCNQNAILLTVRKQNENFGKKFYKCAVGKENGGCDFFLWAPDDNTISRPQPQTNTSLSWGISTGTDTVRNFGSSNDLEDHVCDCNLPCKRITVQKEGPNKGRPFYCCPKPINESCRYFQWADAGEQRGDGSSSFAPTRNRGGGNSSRGRGRGTTSNRSASAGTSTRKCSNCRQEGHTRNKCPELR